MQGYSRLSEGVRASRFVWNVLFSVVFLVLGAGSVIPAAAQFRGSLHGIVTDPQGAAVKEATLTLTDTATNRTLVAKSGANGTYDFNALPPSRFKLTAVAPGFREKVFEDLQIIPEQANAINVQLGIESATVSVDVASGAVPALDTETASISGTVTTNQIEHMPSFGRDVTQLAQLAPGVFGDGGQGASGGTRSLPGTNQGSAGATDGVFKTENGPQVIANGNQTNTNGVTIDGISASSVTWGGTTVVTPTEESVDSVKVTANAYDAEVGRFTGAQIQIISKSGSNRFHGSLFFKAERPGLNAYQRWNGPNSVGPGSYNPDGTLKTPQQRGLNRDSGRFNQYGGSVSGPVLRDKLFASFAYETLRLRTVNYTTGWYETPAFLKMASANSNASKYLTYTGEGASILGLGSFDCTTLGLTEGPYCHLIPGQGLDLGSPLKTPLGSYDPSRSATAASQPGYGSGLDGVADLANYALSSPNTRTATQYYGRMDAQATKKDRLSFIIYWVPLQTVSYNGPVRAANLWNHNQVNDAFTGLWNRVFSPSLLNEARANAAGWRWNEIASNPQAGFGLAQATFGDQRGIFPNVTPNYFGAPNPSVFDQWTYGYQDIVTKVKGAHSLKMGGSLTRLYYLNQNISGARPTFKFANLWNFLNDAPYQENGTFSPSTGTPSANRQDNRNNFWGVFVQDDWKVTPTLTLNLGLRWDYFGPFYDKGQNLRTVVLGQGSAMLTGLSVRKGGNMYTSQKGNLGPQFGFAWTPAAFAQKIVVRGGFGLNYNQNELAITANGNGNPGNIVNTTFCCKAASGTTSNGAAIQYVLPSDLHSVFGYASNPSAITGFNASGLPTNAATLVNVTAFDANVKTIQTYHYSLDTQYDLTHKFVATLGYQGSVSHHLILQQDMNVIAAAAGIPLNPQVTRVGYYGNKGNANYHAMLATVKHNFSRSYQVEAQYTWSKSMDNGSQPYYQDAYPYQLAYSYGRSDYNVGNALKVFGMWQPNFFHNAVLHSVADGWTVTGIYNWHTGFPWTPTWNSGVNLFYGNSGQNTLRPVAYHGTGGHDLSNAAFESGPMAGNSAARNKNFANGSFTYFTLPTVVGAAAFPATAPLPTAPGVSRNSFDGPRYSAVDASITKGFHLPNTPVMGERAIFEFRVDAFNLFNQTNLNGISTSIGTGTTANVNFGQATGALGGRIVDMQARFSF
ncbi:TonB-dependent receptor [Edaphobacter bradus]|uniref:TonB-dependent receptor n=1 Tax=Edaphobacter bradus TaxID=2259016 RepID=UPI0021E0E637|nr:TonB-dependent receptor [Edaphobacter bradus]